MRVAVVGPGAIGVTYAAAVEEAGHEVVLCGRRPAPAPVVERPDGTEHRLASAVVADPPGAGGPLPWVLLAVKAHQTAGAAAGTNAGAQSPDVRADIPTNRRSIGGRPASFGRLPPPA